jgi:hypothetical protein
MSSHDQKTRHFLLTMAEYIPDTCLQTCTSGHNFFPPGCIPLIIVKTPRISHLDTINLTCSQSSSVRCNIALPSQCQPFKLPLSRRDQRTTWALQGHRSMKLCTGTRSQCVSLRPKVPLHRKANVSLRHDGPPSWPTCNTHGELQLTQRALAISCMVYDVLWKKLTVTRLVRRFRRDLRCSQRWDTSHIPKDRSRENVRSHTSYSHFPSHQKYLDRAIISFSMGLVLGMRGLMSLARAARPPRVNHARQLQLPSRVLTAQTGTDIHTTFSPLQIIRTNSGTPPASYSTGIAGPSRR